MNWGSSSIAENWGYLLMSDSRMAMLNRLVRRQQYDATVKGDGTHDGGAPQYGTPWGVEQSRFLSPLGIPCQEPPYGTLTAIGTEQKDCLVSTDRYGRGYWNAEDRNAFATPRWLTHPRWTCFNCFRPGLHGGYAGLLHPRTDIKTGKELWKGRLPVGGETTPMTYTAQNGLQYVVISAGGNRTTPQGGLHHCLCTPST